jgi:hypothetical protein
VSGFQRPPIALHKLRVCTLIVSNKPLIVGSKPLICNTIASVPHKSRACNALIGSRSLVRKLLVRGGGQVSGGHVSAFSPAALRP